MKRYVLDTSALFAYIENEEGVELLESLFEQAINEKIGLYISEVTCIEVYYISLSEQGDQIANERLKLIDDMLLIREPLDSKLTKVIGRIKANNAMSFADCCIAGLAKLKKAVLIHKDPEFEQIEKEIKQLKLPYKQKARVR